jgi:predicted amidophosphoribosyltransferase
MRRIFRTELWTALRDILFPERCLACGAGLQGCKDISYCQACLQDVRFIQEPFCTTCGKPFDNSAGESHLCGYCLKHEWHFTKARAVVCYQAPVAEAVRIFKYNGKMHGLETFAALTRQYHLHHPLPEPELILPVPLHPKRLRKRGFNQALVLCRKLFPKIKERIAPHVLERHQWTLPQTGLNGAERRRNVKNAFRIKNPEKIKNKKLKNKAADVEVFTFARATDRQ